MIDEQEVWLHLNAGEQRQDKSLQVLQKLLDEYAQQPFAFELLRGENGKPYVLDAPHFSYSHCGDLYAYAVADEVLGIDLERVNPRRNFMEIAERHFHSDEVNLLTALDAEQQLLQFFKLWTQKEAWCKKDGAVLWRYLAKNCQAADCCLSSSFVLDGFVCSLATVRPIEKIRFNVLSW